MNKYVYINIYIYIARTQKLYTYWHILIQYHQLHPSQKCSPVSSASACFGQLTPEPMRGAARSTMGFADQHALAVFSQHGACENVWECCLKCFLRWQIPFNLGKSHKFTNLNWSHTRGWFLLLTMIPDWMAFTYVYVKLLIFTVRATRDCSDS